MERDRYRLGQGFSWAERVQAPGRLAYEEQAQIVVLALPTGERTSIDAQASWRSACPLAWSPDGTTLFHSFKGQIDAIDISTGTRRTLTAFTGAKHSGVVWQLQCSPDGRRLLFLKHDKGGKRVVAAATAGDQVRDVCAIEGVWNFSCSWQRDVLLVSVSRPEPKLWWMDLEGQHPRCVLDGSLVSELQVAADGEHAIYELQSAVWMLELRTGKARRIVDHGKKPAQSPGGEMIAFMRHEHDLHVRRSDGHTELVVEGCDNDDTWRPFGWQRQPVWSPNGRLLFFRTTLGKRHAEPLHAEFVAQMRKKKEAAQRRRAKGAKAPSDSTYDHSIEHAHWSFEHSIGIVDFQTREVWMETGHWDSVAWAPSPST